MSLIQDLGHKIFVEDHLLNHVGGLFVSLDVVDKNVVGERKMFEQVLVEKSTDERHLGKV
jgi:hypothetical protein